MAGAGFFLCLNNTTVTDWFHRKIARQALAGG